MGTQRNETSSTLILSRAFVLSTNWGSSEILGINTDMPDSTTFPMIPSPILYLPLAFSSGVMPTASSMNISELFLSSSVKVPRSKPM